MKKIGIFGTGMVGNTIGSKLIQLGYQVKMGSRSANNEKAAAWAAQNGPNASTGTFSDAADFGEIIFNCTKGDASPEVFRLAGADRLKGKPVIDISNPLDFSKGMPPSLMPDYSNTYSMGEELQKLAPGAHIVKTLNIVNCEVMVDAKRSGGDPTMFVSGNDAGAKQEVTDILRQFGWNDVIDLGDITTARGTEMLLPIWLRTWMATGNGHFAFKIVR
ncbi:MAG: NAD(P)-binding domain-containing protein [Saprospirales bacterium]|nr:NAD(P)-binding domain-containing protein [Saprospirales bacterium]